jgi:hypothetical protein
MKRRDRVQDAILLVRRALLFALYHREHQYLTPVEAERYGPRPYMWIIYPSTRRDQMV